MRICGKIPVSRFVLILVLMGAGMIPRILLATPTYDGTALSSQTFTVQKAITDGPGDFRLIPMRNSLLAHGFNECYVKALNLREKDGVTHFAMLHADIQPDEANWLGILYREMCEHKAAMISAVVAIKDWHGLTSTAFYSKSHTGAFDKSKAERIKIDALNEMPTTFDAASAGRGGDFLLANTGLMLVDITQPWVDEKPFACFSNPCWLTRSDGEYRAQTVSEDWNYSIMLQRKGAKVCATQAVSCSHFGTWEFRTKPFR